MTRIFFAGADAHYKGLVKYGVKDTLMSFYYLYGKKNYLAPSNLKNVFFMQREGCRIFLDSGAHTLQDGGGGKSRSCDLDEYMEKYIHFLKKYKNCFEVYVELDVEDAFGLKKVNSMYENMVDEGLNPLRVWHTERGYKNWDEETIKHDYIGIGKFTELPVPILMKLLQTAEKNNCRVHGFGCTKPSLLKILPFYTVDSSSWMAGEKFGAIDIFSKGRITHVAKSAKGKRMNLHYKRIRDFNLRQWVQFQKFIGEYWKGKAYWNKEVKTEV